jgi:probable F420-dependent oxidoreductase
VTASGRNLRFGVVVAGEQSIGTADEWRALAQCVEALGYSSLLVADHFVETDNPPSMVALAWAAAATPTLRIGTLVLGNDYRHPAIVAKDAATLDLLSGGRLELGIGAGWNRADYDLPGRPYDPPGVRVDRLGEALAVIKSTWRGEPFDFSGEHYTIRGYRGHPRPVQRPHPPITIGGASHRMLRLAGREADIVSILQFPLGGRRASIAESAKAALPIEQKLELIREGAGERFDALELQTLYFGVAITDDPRAAAEPLAARYGLGVDAFLAAEIALIGTVDDICAALQQQRDDRGISYVVIQARECEDFAPVVDRLA